MPTTLRLIEHAILLGRAANFVRVPKRTGISHTPVSGNIADPESERGVHLVDPGCVGAAPIVFGGVLILCGASLLPDMDALLVDLRGVAALIHGCDAFLGAVMHLAVACDPPGLALFVDIDPAMRLLPGTRLPSLSADAAIGNLPPVRVADR